jgi:hypothetical protein
VRPRRRPLDPEQERQKAAIDAELAVLARSSSWPALEAEVGRKKELIERFLTRKLLRGLEPVNQREVDFLRGVIEGLTWLVNRPQRAEVSLERYLAENAEVFIGEES